MAAGDSSSEVEPELVLGSRLIQNHRCQTVAEVEAGVGAKGAAEVVAEAEATVRAEAEVVDRIPAVEVAPAVVAVALAAVAVALAAAAVVVVETLVPH